MSKLGVVKWQRRDGTVMVTVRLACFAMRTRFELVLVGDDERELRAVGEAALEEIRVLDQLLSRFHPGSDIARINAFGSDFPIRVDARTFDLLSRARWLSSMTDGAFDITVTPLLERWERVSQGAPPPLAGELNELRRLVGAPLLLLDPEGMTVRTAKRGVQLDLGGVGKGYAIERAVKILRDGGVQNAFIHGGTSSLFAFGRDGEEKGWRVALVHPQKGQILTTVVLENTSLSVSRRVSLSIDPRTGRLAEGASLAAVMLPSPTEAEAWSTALLIMGVEGLKKLRRFSREAWALLVLPSGETRDLSGL